MATEEMVNIIETDKLKKCKTCKELLPLTEYYKDPKSKDRLFYSCKTCNKLYRRNIKIQNPWSDEKREKHNERNRIQYKNNKGKKAEYAKLRRKTHPHLQRNLDYKYKYNITITDYDNILINQNMSCAICKIHQSELNYQLAVDHCHDSKKVRGLLCRNCNLALGYFKDNVDVIKNSIYYLEKFKEDVNK